MLAGTESMRYREMSPLSKLKQTRGIASTKRVPDCYEVRNSLAQKEYPKSGYQYSQPQTHIFRDTDAGRVLGFGQEDMKLLTHPPEIPNAGGIAIYSLKPKFWNERDRYHQEKKRVADGLAGRETWDLYHKKLPLKHVPLAQSLQDRFTKKDPTQFLSKEKWESAYIELARTINETDVVGLP